jgi:hypothetical protein
MALSLSPNVFLRREFAAQPLPQIEPPPLRASGRGGEF